MISDFKKFILRGNVLDLAIAFILGAAFNGVVQSLVKDLLTPLIAAAGGKPNFASMYFIFHHSKFMYGDFVNALISFVILALVLFFLVVRPLNRLVALMNSRKGTPDPTDKKCPECLSTIPIEATRCAYCAVKQPALAKARAKT